MTLTRRTSFFVLAHAAAAVAACGRASQTGWISLSFSRQRLEETETGTAVLPPRRGSGTQRSAARHERLTDRLARAVVSSGCPVGCRSRPAVSPCAPRVGTENVGGRPGPELGSRAAAAVPSGPRGDGGRARQLFRRAAESTGACMFRACPESKLKTSVPPPCPAWARHGMGWCPRQESCMHGPSALQAAADGTPIVRACNGAARRRTHGGACMHRRAGRLEPLLSLLSWEESRVCMQRYVKWSAVVELFGAQ